MLITNFTLPLLRVISWSSFSSYNTVPLLCNLILEGVVRLVDGQGDLRLLTYQYLSREILQVVCVNDHGIVVIWRPLC